MPNPQKKTFGGRFMVAADEEQKRKKENLIPPLKEPCILPHGVRNDGLPGPEMKFNKKKKKIHQ